MTQFSVPAREDVSAANQAIFDQLKKNIGFVPNLYALMAHSETGLGNYLQFQNAKTSLTKKEKEVINLVVSEENGCRYCLSAHTVIGKMNGFTDEQVLEIRKGAAPFNEKLDALAHLTAEVAATRGRPSEKALADFYEQGYTDGHLVDVVMAIADKVVMNYLHNITQIPVDFPAAPELEETSA